MSQKELNYIEDIYNHEKLLVDIMNDYLDMFNIEDYEDTMKKQIKIHESNMNKIKELLGDNCGK